MPFIVIKRSDIPAATLQILDLKPNESQRNLIYDPPGQTKYVNPVVTETVAVTGTNPVRMLREGTGLAAWLLVNVASAVVVQATGTITVAAGNVTAGDTLVIGGVTLTAVAGAPAANQFQIGGTETITATNIAAALNLAGNGYGAIVTAQSAVAIVTVTAVPIGAAGNAITMATNDAADVVLSGATLTGGVSSPAITPAEADDMAEALLDNLLRFGSTDPALAMDLTAVNAQLAAINAGSAITSNQLTQLLQVMGGRRYVVPSGVQVQADGELNVSPAAGAAGGPGFADPYRSTYNVPSVTLSKGTGHLRGFLSSDFVYKGTAGAAVVVYNDDGTLFV